MKLDDKGRCPNCLIKPLVYKTDNGARHPRGKYCHRCSRSFNMETGEQQPNWAWHLAGGEWAPQNPGSDYATAKPDERTSRAAARRDALITSGDGR